MSSNSQHNTLSNFLSAPGLRAGRHLLFITVLVCISLAQSFFVFGKNADLLGNQLCFFTVSLVITYIAFGYFNLYYLAPRFLMKNNYVLYFAALTGLLALIITAKHLAEHHLLSTIGKDRVFNGIALLDGISSLTLNVICFTGSVITLLFNQWVEDTGRIGFLENTRLKNSIAAIKNHISPQLLFSTVAYAASQVKSRPGETSAVLLKLSEVLRYELYDCKREKVLLVADIEFVRNYLTLESQHREGQFHYNISVSGKTNVFVRPYQFMPFVQELVQNGATGINILFEITGNSVKFECRSEGGRLSENDSVRIQRSLC